MGNRKVYKKCLKGIALVMAIVVMMVHSSTTFAETVFDYSETFGVEEIYEIVSDSATVRTEPRKKAESLGKWKKGFYVDGKEILNKKTQNYWIKSQLQDGSYVYIAEKHLVKHEHSFTPIGFFHDEDGEKVREVQLCDCGEYRFLRWTGEEYSTCDSNELVCQWMSGEKNASTAMLDMLADEAIVSGAKIACNPEVIASTEGLSAPVCGGLLILIAARTYSSLKDSYDSGVLKDITFNTNGGILTALDVIELLGAKHINRSHVFGTIDTVSKIDTVREFITQSFDSEGNVVYEPYVEIYPAGSDVRTSGIEGPPSSLSMGNVFSIEGYLEEGEYPFTSVTTEIRDINNFTDLYYRYTDSVNGSYDLKNSPCDMAMLFNQLPQGTYTYRVLVEEQKGDSLITTCIYEKSFSVS